MGLMVWSYQQIQKATHAEVMGQIFDGFEGVGTDTRQDLSGKLFVALRGDQYDAHQFLAQALAKGAKGLLIDSRLSLTEDILKQATVFLVQDTLRALQDLGNFFRRTHDEMNFVAVTGSNGKTTTKEFAAQLISPVQKTHWSQSSFNNHWGVPLTLLATPLDSQSVILEMGMNHAGELQRLVEIAEPKAVVCTMVGRAHLEHFKTMKDLARAKEEIYVHASPLATRIYNLDNDWTFEMWKEDVKRFPNSRKITFSQKNPQADVYFQLHKVGFNELSWSGHILGQKGAATAHVFGLQNLVNLMAASALALSCGLTPQEIWTALPRCKTTWGRNQIESLPSGAKLLFDAYNANPDSMAALLENLKMVQTLGRKIVILGQMLEMGVDSPRLHEELGKIAGESLLDEIYFLGEAHQSFLKGFESAKGTPGFRASCQVFTDYDSAWANKLARGLKEGDLVALKASRGMKLERYLVPLRESI